LAQAGSLAFQSALAGSPRLWKSSASQEKLGQWYFGSGTLLGTILAGLAGLGLMFVQIPVGLLFLVLAGLWFATGLVRPYLVCGARYQGEIAEAVVEGVRASQEDAAALISLATVDQVIEGMTAELAPRPLQKLLMDSGLLKL
jgi:hypothetical protein